MNIKKNFETLYEFFLSRKLFIFILFLISILLSSIDLSIIFLSCKLINQIFFWEGNVDLSLLFILIGVKISFIFIKNKIFQYNVLFSFTSILKKILLFFKTSIYKNISNNDNKNYENLANYILKTQVDVYLSFLNSNYILKNFILFFTRSVFFLIIALVINIKFFNNLNLMVFLITIFLTIINFYFEKYNLKNYEKLFTKTQLNLNKTNNELISNINDLIEKNNNESDFFEKIIDNKIIYFRKLSYNIFSFLPGYLINGLKLGVFIFLILYLKNFIGYKNINLSLNLFFFIIAYFLYVNTTRLLNIIFEKQNLLLINTNNTIIKKYSVDNYHNELEEKSISQIIKKDFKSQLDSNNNININTENIKINHEVSENQTNNQLNNVSVNISIKSINFKNAIISKKFHNEGSFDKKVQLNIEFLEKNSYAIITNDDSNIHLLKLLKDLNSINIEDGDIMINEFSLKNIKIDKINDAIVVVDANDINYELSIRENITIHNQTASDDIIKKTIKLAGISDFINTLSFSYHSHISEELLDEVQKFQISLCAAFLSDCQVIILDFTSINNEDDERIRKIKSICIDGLQDRIVIILTRNTFLFHSISKIILFSQNMIILNSNHNELINSNNKDYIRYITSRSKEFTNEE